MRTYDTMLKTYYKLKQQPTPVEEELTRRRESCAAIHTGFQIGENGAFVMYCDELVHLLCEIQRQCRWFDCLEKRAPALIQTLAWQGLVEEIQQTNVLEGVHSTRKEIGEAMKALEQKLPRTRFMGMVRKYKLLQDGQRAPLNTCQDVRNLYTDFVLPEVVQENADDAPDGLYFRKGKVYIAGTHGQKVHEGLPSESAIMEAMEQALTFLHNQDYEALIRVAAFHYMFGYIHPFYNGNGRMSRFITSQELTAADVPLLIGLRLSYTIKKERAQYYKLFRDANDRHNYGDLTGFVIGLLQIILEAAQDACDQLEEMVMRLEKYEQHMGLLGAEEQQLLYLLCQVSLAELPGLTFKELQEAAKALLMRSGEDHLRSLLKKLGEYCIVERHGKGYRYRANLEALD